LEGRIAAAPHKRNLARPRRPDPSSRKCCAVAKAVAARANLARRTVETHVGLVARRGLAGRSPSEKAPCRRQSVAVETWMMTRRQAENRSTPGGCSSPEAARLRGNHACPGSITIARSAVRRPTAEDVRPLPALRRGCRACPGIVEDPSGVLATSRDASREVAGWVVPGCWPLGCQAASWSVW